MQGLSLDESLLPSLATAHVPVATLTDPTDYGFDSQNVWDVPGALLPDAMGALGGLTDATDPFLTAASKTAHDANQLRRQLGRFIGQDGQAHYNTKVKYPDGDFAHRLAGLAALLHAGFPIRAVALQAPGEFDTHSDEGGPLADGLQQTAQALAAFQADLEQRHLGSRVRTLLWSEFGRRAEQNDSNGTDHGAAGVGVHDRREPAAQDDRRVPGPRSRRARPEREPEGDGRLPRRLRVARRAVVPRRRRAGASGREEDAAVQPRLMRRAALLAHRDRCRARRSAPCPHRPHPRAFRSSRRSTS